MLAQSIIGTAFYSAGGGGNPTPVGDYIFNGTTYSYWAVGGTGASNPTIWFPGGSQFATVSFDGNGWQMTQPMGANSSFFINFWMYPTSNNREVMTETNGASPGYYYNMMEIDSNGYLNAGTWNGGNISSVVTTNKVVLNSWNHVYFYYDATESGGTIHLELNGATPAVLNNVTRNGPDTSYMSFGYTSATSITGASTPYFGYIDAVEIYSSLHGTNYSLTKNKYQANPVFALRGDSYTSGNWVDSISSKSFTLYNSPTWSSTNGGQFRFDKNSSQYGECISSLPLLSSFTLQGVFKIHSTSALGSCLITEKWPAIAHINYAIGFINATSQIDAGFFDQNQGYWNVLSATTSPTTDTWYDIVMTFYGPTRELKVYLNGTLVTSQMVLGSAVSDGQGIRIARRWDNADYFDCTIKDINIWSGVMSETEIANQHIPYNSLT